MIQHSVKSIPSLVQLCIRTAVDNVKYMGDVGETDMDMLRQILPHCTVEQLTHIENCTEGRDLSPVTDMLWRKFYELNFGKDNLNLVIKRMKQKRVIFKWRQLYEAKLKERDEAQERTVARLRKLYAEESAKKQSRQIRLCSKVPPSRNKRSFIRGSGSSSSSKGSLMKKARMEFFNSHEVKMHQAMPLKEKVPYSSISCSSRPLSFNGKSSSSASERPAAKF